MIPPRPGDVIIHGEDQTRHEALYFDPNTQSVGTRAGEFPLLECSVLERRSDQEIFDRAHVIEQEGYPVREFHPEIFNWDRQRT